MVPAWAHLCRYDRRRGERLLRAGLCGGVHQAAQREPISDVELEKTVEVIGWEGVQGRPLQWLELKGYANSCEAPWQLSCPLRNPTR